MKEKISRLARGIIDASVPEIRISREKIEDVIPCDGIYRGDFRIVSGNQLAFRGLIYSTNPKVRLGQDYFAGVDAQLTYEVETDRLKDGMRHRRLIPSGVQWRRVRDSVFFPR